MIFTQICLRLKLFHLYSQVHVGVLVNIGQTTHAEASQNFLDVLCEVCNHRWPGSLTPLNVWSSKTNLTCQSPRCASRASPCSLCPFAQRAFPGMGLWREHLLVPADRNNWKKKNLKGFSSTETRMCSIMLCV